VKLAGIGCQHTFFAKVLDDGQVAIGSSVEFSLTQQGVVSLFPVTGVTGSYRAMLAHAFAATPGTTQLIATHRSGAADTVTVQVGNAPPTIAMYDLAIAAGSTFSGTATPRSACGDPVYSAVTGYWDPTPTTFSSLAPEIVQVEGLGAGADFKVAGLKRGIALVEARYHDAVDTARVEVRDVVLEPADTAIRVGDVVHYRFLVSDANGNLVPDAGVWQHTDSTVAEMPKEGDFRAAAAGVDTIRAFTSSVLGGLRTAVLRVEAP
jgi:hypothetical protein